MLIIIAIFIFLIFYLVFYLINNLSKKNIIDNFSDCYKNYPTKSSSQCNNDFTLNGVNYNDNNNPNISITPCLPNNLDFNEWCKFYERNGSSPTGNTINGIGAKYVLSGQKGDCYLPNNPSVEDKNSSRAVCDFNYIDEVTKLEPAFDDLKYNVFTDCKLESELQSNCASKLNSNNVKVDQIMGYDCVPGYYRGKCVLQGDNDSNENQIIINNTFYKTNYI